MEQGDQKVSQRSVISRLVGEALNQCFWRIHSVLIKGPGFGSLLGKQEVVHESIQLSLYTLPVLE